MTRLIQAEPIADFEPELAPEVFVPPRRRRRLLWGALLLSLVAGGLGAAYRLVAGQHSPTASYRTEAPSRGSVVKQVSATGTLSPLVTVSVGSQVSGRIKEILVDYNSEVKKGQVIARLDDRSLKAALSKARANVTAARANLTKANASARETKLQYERDRGLAAQQLVAPAELDSRLAAYQSAKAQVVAANASLSQAQAALEEADINVAYATIVSPIDGVVVARSVDVGQTVAASLQAPTLFLIAEDLRKMEVHTSVAESDIGLIAEGLTVRFTVDAYANRGFEGKVKQVRYEAQSVQNVVTYDAVVSVDNSELKLRPGMTANVMFIVDERHDVLRAPVAALRFSPGGADRPRGNGAGRRTGWRPVWVLQGGQPRPIRIKVGLSDGSNTEVLEGPLTAAHQLITAVLEEKGADPVRIAGPGMQTGRRGRGRIL